MTREDAEGDMLQGYMDGLDLSSPEPSGNRSHSYRHGFSNGRYDRTGGKPERTFTVAQLRERAETLLALDLSDAAALLKAQGIQGQVRGGLALLDRMVEMVNELSANAEDSPSES